MISRNARLAISRSCIIATQHPPPNVAFRFLFVFYLLNLIGATFTRRPRPLFQFLVYRRKKENKIFVFRRIPDLYERKESREFTGRNTTKRDRPKEDFFQQIVSCCLTSLSITLGTPKARIVNAIKKDKETYYLSLFDSI